MKTAALAQPLAAACLLATLTCCIGGCPPNRNDVGQVTATPPQITDPIVEGPLAQGQSATVTVSATVKDPDGTVMSVTVDLTPLGGQPARSMEKGDNDIWSWKGTVTPPKIGKMELTITATDAQGATATATVAATVVDPGTLPQITNLAANSTLTLNKENTVSLTVSVTDTTDAIQEVSADLSQIGGSATQALTQSTGDQWTFSGTVTPTVEGVRTITFIATDKAGGMNTSTANITVARVLDGPPVVLAVDGLSDDHKTSPGAGLSQGDLVRVQLSVVQSVNTGQVTLELASGAGKVNIWGSANKSDAVTLPQTWTLPGDTLPAAIYVEGASLSDSARDVQLTVSYEDPHLANEPGSLSDSVYFTIVGMQRNGLGGSTDLSGMNIGKVYIPTQYGGQLTVSGGNVQLIYTDGSDLQANAAVQVFQGSLDGSIVAEGDPCTWTVPEGKKGWCYIRLAQDSPATVSSSFEEDGQASYRPWNGWWWPFITSSGPTLYDAGGPMDKYDQIYGTDARGWEQANEGAGAYWFGHCWGWSIAAILLPEPQATTKNGISFTSDDMKGLYTELADCNPYFDSSLSITSMPWGPCTDAMGEDIDKYCDEFYRIMRTCIRQEGVPLQSNMRAIDTPPNRVEEQWNQSIYKYAASFSEVDGNEHLMHIFMQVWSNFGPYPPPTDDSADRYEEFVVQLEFDSQGQLVPQSSQQNWISASHYPPANLYRLTGSPWSAPNPYITKSRIDGLYQP